MNENKIIYRKEYVDNAIELLKTSENELEESIEHISKSLEKILNANEFPYLENIDKNIKETEIPELLKGIMLETSDNTKLLETSTQAVEEYNKEIETRSYQNPETGSTPNPSIKNGPAIAALAGLATVGASVLLEKEEEKEKTES